MRRARVPDGRSRVRPRRRLPEYIGALAPVQALPSSSDSNARRTGRCRRRGHRSVADSNRHAPEPRRSPELRSRTPEEPVLPRDFSPRSCRRGVSRCDNGTPVPFRRRQAFALFRRRAAEKPRVNRDCERRESARGAGRVRRQRWRDARGPSLLITAFPGRRAPLPGGCSPRTPTCIECTGTAHPVRQTPRWSPS